MRRTWPEAAAVRCRPPATACRSGRLRPYADGIATHYDILGVEPDASAERIRAAYRERARMHHPDRVRATGGEIDAMPDVNEAYRVLSDPVRRREYDRSIRVPGSAVPSTQDSNGPAPTDVGPTSTPVPPSRLMPAGPARVPWKLMAVMAVIGSAVILFAAAFNDAPAAEPPDGILRVGSCVEIEPNFDVREVACTGDGDTIVELVIPTDATCPVGLGTFRDRLGLGRVCIEVD